MPSYTFTLNVETEVAEARLRAFRATAEKELSSIQAATISASGGSGRRGSGFGGGGSSSGGFGGGSVVVGQGGGLAEIEKFKAARERERQEQIAGIEKLNRETSRLEQERDNITMRSARTRMAIRKRETDDAIRDTKRMAAEVKRAESATRQMGLMQLEAQRMNQQFDAGQLDGQGRPINKGGGGGGGGGLFGSTVQGVLKTGFLAYGAGLAARAAVQGVTDFAHTGAMQLRTMETLEYIGDRVGVNSEKMADAVKKATNSSISDMQAMSFSANILAQRFAGEVDDISGDTATLAKASRRLAQVYADENGDLLSTEAVFSRLVKFAREGNKELVDQFGISNELIAETLGIPNEGLRGAEGAANRWRGMVMILNEELQRLGEPTDSVADKMEQDFARMTTALDGLRQEAAEPISIVIHGVANVTEGELQRMSEAIRFWKMVGKEITQQSPSDVFGNEISRIQSGNNRGFLAKNFGINPNQQRIDELQGLGSRLENLPFVGRTNALGGANWEDTQKQADVQAGMAEMWVKLTSAQDGYLSKSKEGRDILVNWTSLMREWESGQLTSLPGIVSLYEELLTKLRELEALRENSAALVAEDFAPSANGALAAARANATAALQVKTLQDTALPSAQFLVAGENIKKMSDAGIEGTDALKTRHDELSKAMTAAATATDPFIRGIWAAASAMQAASLIGDVAGLMGKTYGPQAQNAVFGDVQGRLPKVEDGPEGWTKIINELFGDVTETQIAEATEQTRIAKQNAEKAAQAWKQTAKEVERMFESAADKIMSIPGVSSITPVTAQELLDTEFGQYEDKPDEWRRRAHDELTSFYRMRDADEYGNVTERLIPRTTKDYPDVSREQIEALTGMPAGTPHDVMLPRLDRMWESSSLFADPANLGLMNMDSIRASFEEMKAGQIGRQNQRQYIMEQLGVSMADASLITGTQAPIVQMMTGGQSESEITAQLGPVANTLRTAAMASLTSGTGFMAEISAGWKKDIDENITKLDPLGDMIGRRLRDRINTTIGGLGLIDGIVARVIAELAEGM